MKPRKKAKLHRGKISTFIAAIIFVIAAISGLNLEDSSKFDGKTYVHFVDVGQGSCTIIQNDKNAILIDSGESKYADEVTEYLQDLGVDTLELVVASHPHADHIGSMVEVMSSFDVGTIIMPKLTQSNTPTTKTYENFLDYIIENKIQTKAANPSDEYDFGDGELEIFAPVEQNDDLNNMSIICRFEQENSSFMILADAEIDELKTVDLNDTDLKSDVIAAGHHGSRTSIYEPFLDKVDASQVVISCAKDNEYGHPHDEAIEYYSENDVEILRTDELGSIVFEINDDTHTLVD